MDGNLNSLNSLDAKFPAGPGRFTNPAGYKQIVARLYKNIISRQSSIIADLKKCGIELFIYIMPLHYE